MTLKRGKFITFEGVEGGGKSTQIQRLADWFREQGREVLVTKQPGGTAIGSQIRQTLLHVDHAHMEPWCEALLYLADRAQHVRQVIEPHLSRGVWVLCDRYQDSTVVYQGVARQVDSGLIDAIYQQAALGLKPDLTIILDLDVTTGVARARSRNVELQLSQAEGRFEEEDLSFHRAVREGFIQLAAREPHRVRLVDATEDAEHVFQLVRDACEAVVHV